MPLYLHNGSLLVVNGALATSADCCCGPTPAVVGAIIDFKYWFQSEPPGQYAVGGAHSISVGMDPNTITNQSETWDIGTTWSYCASEGGCIMPCSGTGCIDGSCRNHACGDGKAAIRAVFTASQEVRFSLRDNKEWSQPWSSPMFAQLSIHDIQSGTKVQAYKVNGSYQYTTTTPLTLTFDSTNGLEDKTSGNTVNWYVTVNVAAV